jgi:hypothetical protein
MFEVNSKDIVRKVVVSLLLIICILSVSVQAQGVSNRERSSAFGSRYTVSTSWLTFTNWIGENIQMYELFLGYKVTKKDKVSLKLATWKLFEPMGIQFWNPNLLKKSEWFEGRIREYGVGIGYQRMLWKGLFAAVEVMPMLKVFLDENGEELEKGFRLYTSYHVGYHIPLWNNRLYLETQIHCNYWPVNSAGPDGFREQSAKHDNYFLFEPNLYIGFEF